MCQINAWLTVVKKGTNTVIPCADCSAESGAK